MALSDIARTDALTAAPDTPIRDVATAMGDRDEDVVVVLDEGRPLGLLTAAKIGRRVGTDDDLRARAAADLLDGGPVTIRGSADHAALLSLFAEAGARHALVTDEGEAYVGVVSFDDVLVRCGRELAAALDLLEADH